MAVVTSNCLGLDIGSHHIRIAYLEMGRSGPRIVQLLEAPLEVEEGVPEAQRFQQIGKQVQEMLREARIRTKNAVFSIPGQSVFVRRIKLPRTSEERMQRIIRYEARQQIPFPLDKTIMEYQVFEEEDSPEANVLLVAIKREFILNFMRMVRRTGLRAVGISVSTLALFNFHEANSSDRPLTLRSPRELERERRAAAAERRKQEKGQDKKRKKLKGKQGEGDQAAEEALIEPEEDALEAMGFEEIQAYVNLGSSLMDIAIPKPGPARMIGFPRSVPLAGNEMDRAVKDRLNLESLEAARKLKEEQVAILSTEYEMQGEEGRYNRQASEAATAVADRMINELRRSLDFYISQPDGVAVDSLVLSGGLARMPFLAGYIEEKMGLPVELAELKNPNLRPPDTPPESFAPYAVAVGLALQGLRVAQSQIDFLPEDIKNIRGIQERRWEGVALVAMLFVVILLNLGVGGSLITRYNQQSEAIQQTMVAAQRDSQVVNAATGRFTKVNDAYEQLAKAVGWRDYWLLFLKGFIERRPADILIDELHMRADGAVIIRGRSPNLSSVQSMLDRLNPDNWAGASWGIELGSTSEVFDPTFGTRVHRFEVVMKTLVRGTRVRTMGQNPVNPNAGNTNYNRNMGAFGFGGAMPR
ncbi:MAG TPA: pilus assembly protein PilM [Candidatus Sumerlaeota bacterium]|nr:pilus assembly protein PilM [Candidatus Sumerlaeota bacterium]HPK01703.1 pilus assembly protein PilM [Candidatus Sumerlaeota bacterium]